MKTRRIAAVLWVGVILSALIFVFITTAFAAEDITVTIVSFTRGEQEDLRSSELLEARVIGYDGNVRDLTYKWTNGLGTYLYVYNSHNMYGINNTDGEIEIYNDSVSSSANMSGHSYKDSFSGVGFAWAAVYGADLSSSALVGTVTVEVFDADGTLLATDSHTGTRTITGYNWFWPIYEYHGFVENDLEEDVSNIAFGLFRGDTKNVQILLGESSIVHITCAECSVTDVEIIDGADIVEVLADSTSGEYHIKSLEGVDGDTARISVSVEKGNCKFHQRYTSTCEIAVYVYEKPVTTSTATAIMLYNLDDNCTYYIDGAAGERKLDENGEQIVIFEGLTPNTEYQIETVGYVEGTDPVYAYVYETTKPAHTGTVEVILNGTYDTSTGIASGERVDISTVLPDCETLYLRYEDSEIYFPLERTSTGVYTTVLSDGNYTVYSADNAAAKLSDQVLTINGTSRTRELFFNRVTYDTNGGSSGPEPSTEYHLAESNVTVSKTVPEKEGYLFTGWTDENGNVYKGGDTLTNAIAVPYTLTAQYVESLDVYVNITIKHICEDGTDFNNDRGRHDIAFTLDQRFAGESDYTELVSKTIDWDGTSEFTDAAFTAEYINEDERDRTVYTSAVPMLVNVAKEAEYTFTAAKSGYDLMSVENTYDENGDLHVNAELIFNPNDFDLVFSVELDDESKKVDDTLKPVAVNVKVLAFGNTPYDEDYGLPEGDPTVAWYTITQQRETYERIALDENGEGSGTYPVWMATTDTHTPYVYRIEVVSYELPDGSVITASDIGGEHITYATADNRYSANITVTGGKDPSADDDDTLTGAWYENGVQNGEIKAVVTIEVFNVTFDPNGGTLNGSTDNLVVERQIGIPLLSDYVPERAGGYVFDGWYLADKDGNITDTKAVSEEIIFDDETLIAKWKEPLTVKGNVAVAGTYETDDGVATIYDHDRISSVLVLLQRIDANGYAETIAYNSVPVTYSGDYGLGEYSFSEVKDEGHSFRIKVVLSNYHTHYLNETSSADISDYDSYSEEEMYMAEFSDDTEANVHIYLHFMPESFDLKYEVDVTYIGEGFRPEAAEVLVLCDTGEHIDPQHWDVISQMLRNGEFVGNVTQIIDGKGAGSESVWEIKPDGSTPYHYSIRIDSLTIGGQEVVYSDGLPFAVYYNGSARYDEVSGQTQTLVASILPRMYTVTFDMGDISHDVKITNMDSYMTVDQTFEDTYYWSRGKSVDAQPVAEGYTFLGWYDADDNRVSDISADSSGDITLSAKWIPEAQFEVLADAGYYAEARDAEEKEGIISFNARVSNIDDIKDYVISFGIYIYNSPSGTEVRATAESTDLQQLVTDGGYFHALVSKIRRENFDSSVFAVPYIVTDGGVVKGETMMVAVSNINKWLGTK